MFESQTKTKLGSNNMWPAAPQEHKVQTAGLKVPFAEGSVKGIAQQMTRWLEEHQVG